MGPINEVGGKIKAIRRGQGMSLEELSQKAGIPPRQLERIENDVDLPSLAPLIKIARVLGVHLGTFLHDDSLPDRGPAIYRKGEQLSGIRFSNNALENRRHMTYHSLSRTKAERHMEPFLIDIEPVGDGDFVLSTHEGEEFIMVMEGTVEVTYGDELYLLQPGDTIYYDSQVPHHIHAYQGGAARVLAVFYTPV